jgi:POT family proton-dependent oligopeptide transporter
MDEDGLTFGKPAGLTYNQINNNLTSQAGEMSTHGVPNDVLSNLDPLALILLIPICDLLVCI